MNIDLKIIKKKYGENMMKLCREFFPTLLEQEGLLSQIMLDSFEPSHDLYDDIVLNNLSMNFKNYIYNITEKSEEKKAGMVIKTPEELLSEAGYNLYECNSEEEIQSFKKYYEKKERLCTFYSNRLNRCHVFFAVKKNVEEIKREDFDNPKRQDLYGTSVISIQFTKDEFHTLSIKNRYNDTVGNPDATFSNDLDNIIAGLTESFGKYYGMVQKYKTDSFEIPNYVCVNGKYYKYNYEINNVYYCPNNIIIDNFRVKKLEREKYIVLDYFILDLQNKKIMLYNQSISDSFVDGIDNIQSIEIEKLEKEKKVIIKNDNKDIIIKLDGNNRVVGYINENIEKIRHDFLYYNNSLQEITLSEVKEIGNYFLKENETLQKITISEVEKIGRGFLWRNNLLQEITLPEVKEIGDNFLSINNSLQEITLPKVEKIKDYFLSSNDSLQEITLPEVKEIENGFLSRNQILQKITIPKVKEIGDDFLYYNNLLQEITLPEVKEIGDNFLSINKSLQEITLPKVEKIKDYFLSSNDSLQEITLPKIEKIGNGFLSRNQILQKITIPEVKEIGDDFLEFNKTLQKITIPEVKKIGNGFLYSNNSLQEITLLKVEKIGDDFLSNNEILQKNKIQESIGRKI